ncbi:glutamate--tRNA ligase, partial [Chloroflexota bacterium]
LDSLRWLELNWDEGPEAGGKYGPYYQSQRLETYREMAERLIDQGDAYRCYCSPQRLEAMRAEQMKNKRPPGYDRRCRDLSPEERAAREAEGITPVVRFKIPLTGQTSFSDTIRGEVTFENGTLDDFVLLKSDGYPTYHLANVVDDHLMEISHVLRAEEWISSAPRHILLYRALGFAPPQLVHLPIILGSDRSKLSKRHGSVAITEYRDQGYLPETMVNFLALLGWSLDDKTELMSRDELVQSFSLERVSRTAAIFNREKLDWMNGVYIRNLSSEEFTRRALPFLERGLPAEVKRPLSTDYVKQITPLIQERVKTMAEVAKVTRFFFINELDLDLQTLIVAGMDERSTRKALEVVNERLEKLEPFDENSLEELLRPLAEELGLKTRQLFGTLRTSSTGESAAPPLFQTMAVLGRERCLERIAAALEKLPR